MKQPWCVSALRGVLGDWVFYSALMSPAELALHVLPAHRIREAKALEDYLQRALKPRVNRIADYLRRRESRFFSAIIIGVFEGLPDWSEFAFSKSAAKEQGREMSVISDSIGVLRFSGHEKMFAIDGQHRVEGIKTAFAKDRGKLEADQYPVIFVAHLDTPEGKVRTRRLFCDINKNAVSVSPGDKVVIDEDDLAAIVTRRLYVEYPHFKRGRLIAVSERKEQVEQEGEARFTSLLALHTVSRKLRRLFRKPRGTLESAPENVEQFKAVVSAFFDFVIEHEASLNAYFVKGDESLVTERTNNRNLLFRPVGLEVLSRIYAHCHSRDGLQRLAVGLRKLKFINPGGHFESILWNEGRISAGAKEKSAAVDLCLYLMGEINGAQADSLRERLRLITHNQSYELPAPVL